MSSTPSSCLSIEYQVEEQTPTFHALSEVPVYKSRYYDRLSSEHQHEVDEVIEFKRREVMRSVEALPSYDVFLSLKIDGEGGAKTPEYDWAMQLYYDLRDMGYKVFFSPQVLKTTNSDWEPYIYRAIQTCRIMLVLTSSIDNTNAPWVRNEWRRILSRIQNTPEGEQAPVYRVIASDKNCVPPRLMGKQVLFHGDMHLLELVKSAVRGACCEEGSTTNTANFSSSHMIHIPPSIESAENYQILEQILRDAGFTNVQSFPLNDMKGFDKWSWREGSVVSIKIAGEQYSPHNKRNSYPPAMPIIIAYHSPPKDDSTMKGRQDPSRGSSKPIPPAPVPTPPQGKKINKWVALILCIFLGLFGAHRFYEEKNTGVIFLLTRGLFYVGWVIDINRIFRKPNPYYVRSRKKIGSA